MARTALNRIVALAAIAIAPAALTACAGSLENPERFGAGGGDGGAPTVRDGGTPSPGTDAGGDTPEADGGGGTTTPAWQTVLADNCAGSGCHGESSPALGLDLVSPGARDRLVGVAAVGCADQVLVVAGDPEASYLYNKIAEATPVCGGRMPLLRSALSTEDQEAIRAWIAGL